MVASQAKRRFEGRVIRDSVQQTLESFLACTAAQEEDCKWVGR